MTKLGADSAFVAMFDEVDEGKDDIDGSFVSEKFGVVIEDADDWVEVTSV